MTPGWTANAGIMDLASNLFAGLGWTYTLDPPAELRVAAGADRLAGQGDAVSLAEVSFSAPSSSTNLTATIDWGNGSSTLERLTATRTNLTAGHVYTSTGQYVITINLEDGAGNSTRDSLQASITNVPPLIVGASDLAFVVGQTVSLTGIRYADRCGGSNHAATVDWGDGGSEPVQLEPVTGEIHATHTYQSNVVHTIRVRVTDEAGAVATNEIVAYPQIHVTGISRQPGEIALSWVGGQPSFRVQELLSLDEDSFWNDRVLTSNRQSTLRTTNESSFIRIAMASGTRSQTGSRSGEDGPLRAIKYSGSGVTWCRMES